MENVELITLKDFLSKKRFVFRFLKKSDETEMFTQTINLFAVNLAPVPGAVNAVMDIETNLRIAYTALVCLFPERYQIRMDQLARKVKIPRKEFVHYVMSGKMGGESYWDSVDVGLLLRARDAAKVNIYSNTPELEARWKRFSDAVDIANVSLVLFYELLEKDFPLEVRLLPPLKNILINKMNF